MSESHSSATPAHDEGEVGPLTGHRVRYDGLEALCGSLQEGTYLIRFDRTSQSLRVAPSRALEDLGIAKLYIDQPVQKPKPQPQDSRRCSGEDGWCDVFVTGPAAIPATLVYCTECREAKHSASVKRRDEQEAARAKDKKDRRIAKDKREPHPDREAFSKTYGSVNRW